MLVRLSVFLCVMAGCELRGLSRAELVGTTGPDAAPRGEAAVLDANGGPHDASRSSPDASRDPSDRPPSSPPDRATNEPDAPVAPPEGILVTGFVSGVCDNRGAWVGGAGAHTCAYDGKNSYRLRIRNVAPGETVRIGARRDGYLPDPNTATIRLEATGNTQDFHLTPVSGSCDRPPDAAPCVCDRDAGCEPS